MAKSESQRQKRLAKKNAKAKAKRSSLVAQKQRLSSLAGMMQAASHGVVLDCSAGLPLSSGEVNGMIPVILRRRATTGGVAMAVFLVDCWCLGVKDCSGQIISRDESDDKIDYLSEQFDIEPMDVSVGRSLVEEGVAYAESLGLSPHPDYRRVSPIWGDVKSKPLPLGFEFGVDGRPTYIVGPYDDPHRRKQILNALRENVGEGNFGWISPLDQFASGSELQGWDELPEEVLQSIEQR